MSYEQFLEKVEQKLDECVGEDRHVYLRSVLKNNGHIRKGITFQEAGINISPTIYMEEYYARYLKTGDMEQIVQSIIDLYKQVRFRHSWEANYIRKYTNIKDKIIYQIVNRRDNRELLQDVPYVPYLDLAIIFYVLVELEKNEERMATMLIKKEHLEWWGIKESDLYRIAHENTERLLPYEFAAMSVVVGEIMGLEELENTEDDIFILTNSIRNYGAAAILYEHRLERIADYFKENYYVLPSSVHEVIIIPESKVFSKHDLSLIVKEVNETQVQKEEILSDHAYYYDRHKKRLTL